MGSISISQAGLEIIDIRRSEIETSIFTDLKSRLRPAHGAEKSLPTILLYDQTGLKLFEKITYLDEYYLTNAELHIILRCAERIAERILSGSKLVELGSGNLRKILPLLKALDCQDKDIEYYALDLNLQELDRTLEAVPPGTFRHVECRGLYGTYEDGLEWLKLPGNRRSPKVIMSMGSSLGNFDRSECVSFLESFSTYLQPQDVFLIGLDGCVDNEKVLHAYNDSYGVTESFYRNGLKHANAILGLDLFKQGDWDVVGEFDELHARHQAFIVAKRDICGHGFGFAKGERILLEHANKYNCRARDLLWKGARLNLGTEYTGINDYTLSLLSPAAMSFSLDPSVYAANPVPSLEEFKELWKLWDLVSLHMIPHHELHSKPIYLRNCCIFYLGHIPAFLDIHLTRATGGKATEPGSYHAMFERGIDPDVDNPAKCHAHSEIPQTWPAIDDILEYQQKVRQRVVELYDSKLVYKDSTIGKAMWLGFEHEAMHIETFLYMLLQSDKTVPPPGVKPDFEELARQARAKSTPNQWVNVPQQRVSFGLDDSTGFWGWDNEKPVRTAMVPSFEAKSRPLTNGDYAKYLAESDSTAYPVSWIVEPSQSHENIDGSHEDLVNGYSGSIDSRFLAGKFVRTVYGKVSLILALDWPVIGSYDELARCAAWYGGRIPTMEEARSIYTYAEQQKVPNGSKYAEATSIDPLHADLHGCNVAFTHFHPMPVTLQQDELSGLSGMGGAWEWTSTALRKWDGFEPMKEYLAYTADFLDGKHNIVLGGSWATHSRIAGRKSFINFYQRNYPYAWVGARMVRDFPT